MDEQCCRSGLPGEDTPAIPPLSPRLAPPIAGVANTGANTTGNWVGGGAGGGACCCWFGGTIDVWMDTAGGAVVMALSAAMTLGGGADENILTGGDPPTPVGHEGAFGWEGEVTEDDDVEEVPESWLSV